MQKKGLRVGLTCIALAVMVTVILSGCGKKQQPVELKKTQLTVAVASIGPTPGGLPSVNAPPIAYYSGLIQETLLQVDGTGKLIPNVVEKWEISPSGTTITFHLRKGVQFHDGWGELTADDVKFSIENATIGGSTNVTADGFRGIKGVKISDPYTLELTVSEESAIEMPYLFTQVPNTRLNISSKAYVEKVGTQEAIDHPIGTGPFKFAEFKVGDYYKLEAAKEYWGKKPAYDILVLKEIPEEATRVMALEAGDVDLSEVPSEFKERLEKKGLRFATLKGNAKTIVSFNIPDPQHSLDKFTKKAQTSPWLGDAAKYPLDDPNALKVRKALSISINTKEIAEKYFDGNAELLKAPGIDPGTIWEKAGWEPYPYDPELAKKLLAEAGYPKGFKVKLYLYSLTGREYMPQVGRLIGEYWRQIGLDVEYVPTDYSFVRPKLVERSLDGPHIYGVVKYPEPWIAWSAAGSTWQHDMSLFPETAKMDESLSKIRRTYDLQERIKLTQEVAEYYRDAYLVPLIVQPHLFVGQSDKIDVFPTQYGSNIIDAVQHVTLK